MYAAWDKDHCDFIDNFQPAQGHPPVKLKITNWIEKLPPILILQMNRTTLNEKTKVQEKLLHTVPILHQLNPHRFLLMNRDYVEQKREKVDHMRAQVQYLKENLDQFTPQPGLSYAGALESTLSLIKKQGELTKFSSG